MLKYISWLINICLKYFMAPAKTLPPLSCILNVRSLEAIDFSQTNFANYKIHKMSKATQIFENNYLQKVFETVTSQ